MRHSTDLRQGISIANPPSLARIRTRAAAGAAQHAEGPSVRSRRSAFKRGLPASSCRRPSCKRPHSQFLPATLRLWSLGSGMSTGPGTGGTAAGLGRSRSQTPW
jgi:hypothetical protein